MKGATRSRGCPSSQAISIIAGKKEIDDFHPHQVFPMKIQNPRPFPSWRIQGEDFLSCCKKYIACGPGSVPLELSARMQASPFREGITCPKKPRKPDPAIPTAVPICGGRKSASQIGECR